MSELKPCPFCGGEASKRLFYKGKYRVHCNVCDAHSGDVCDTEAEAIEAWNTRAERTCKLIRHGSLANMPSFICWSCSECGFGWHHSENDKQFSYCPNCGARVTLKNSETTPKVVSDFVTCKCGEELERKVDPASIQADRNVYVNVSILIDDFNAALEHYVNHVIDEITKRDVEQVSERLRALGWEEVVHCRDCKKRRNWTADELDGYDKAELADGWCKFFRIGTYDDFYCAWGERSEE